MRTTRPYLLLLAVLQLGLAMPASAATIAIAVRERSEADEAPLLADLVEQAAMDRLFVSGHIVFDLDIDPDDEVFSFRAVDQAEFGGAATVLVIELLLDPDREDLQMPGRLIVEYIDVETEDALGSTTIRADQIPRYQDLPAGQLAERLGDEAARLALATLGGDSTW